MNSTPPTANSLPNGAPSSMMLPETVVGIIDLTTLENIHHYLNQSALKEDLALAAWVKEHFLYEPITSPGREICTTEGFSQLDRAYRRVRSLTNKAQDKWPFFNRAWKEMSATDVRNNARGETAPGVTLPGMSNAVHDSLMSYGQYARTGYITSTPSPFVPFGVSKPTRYNAQRAQRRQSSPNRVPNTPIPLPPTKQGQQSGLSGSEKQPCDQEQSKSKTPSQPDSTTTQGTTESTALGYSTRSESQLCLPSDPATKLGAEAVKTQSEELMSMFKTATAASNMPRIANLVQPSTQDAASDPDGGKVRGVNGRFMPKENSTRSKRGSKAKVARKSKGVKNQRVDLDNVEPTSPAPVAFDEEVMVDAPLTPASVDRSKEDNKEVKALRNIAAEDIAPAVETTVDIIKSGDRSGSEPTSNYLQDSMSPAPVYTLAAESDAVFSNLDRLPPSSLRNKKRKNEATAQEGPRPKRGRPGSSQESKQKGKVGDKGALAQPPAAVEEEAPMMSTRRTSRRSAAANLNHTTPVKHTPKKQAEQAGDFEDEAIVDVDDEDATAGHKVSPPASVVIKAPSPHITRPPASTIPETPSKLEFSASEENSNVAEPVDPLALGLLKTNSEPIAPEMPSGTGGAKVEFFARVQTPTGMVEVLVMKDSLQDDVEIIEKYAEWMEKEGLKITFHAFKSIFGLAKKD